MRSARWRSTRSRRRNPGIPERRWDGAGRLCCACSKLRRAEKGWRFLRHRPTVAVAGMITILYRGRMDHVRLDAAALKPAREPEAVFNERHLRGVLSRYFQYHHTARTHLSLDKDCPQPRRILHFSTVVLTRNAAQNFSFSHMS